MQNMRATFTKQERLCGKKTIEELMQKGRGFTLFPFRVIWQPVLADSPYPAKVAIAVPKKIFKKAVHRNRIKRQVREAYRKNKWRLYEALAKEGQKYHLMLIFTAKEAVPYNQIEDKIKEIISRLTIEHEKANK